MQPDESITVWLGRLKAGGVDNALPLWRRYQEALVRLARRKLGASRRRVADEEDVVLSAFDGFLRGVADGRFPQLEDRDDLWQVLVMLTERRAVSLRRREQALKRGQDAVRGESAFAAPGGEASRAPGIGQAADKAPTPEFAAQMTEQMRELLTQLPDENQRQIVLGKLQGFTNLELAEHLGLSLRSVERKLGLIRDQWNRLHHE